MKITCIMCPVGCELDVKKVGNKISVKGNGCPRGVIFGEKEITHPERMVTTIKVYKNGTVSLKTDKPVPKKVINAVLQEIKKTPLPEKVEIGMIFIKNVMLSGANIVVTNIN